MIYGFQHESQEHIAQPVAGGIGTGGVAHAATYTNSVVAGFGIIPGLSLSTYGNVNTYQTTFNHAEPDQVLIASAPIPALSVPEAETYSMMVAGQGLVGFKLRYRALPARVTGHGPLLFNDMNAS